MALLVKLYHLGVLGLYVYVSYFLISSGFRNAQSNDVQTKIMGRYTFRFLTNWTYGVQMLYFTCCVLVHFLEIISPLRNVKEKINSFGNSLFTTIAAPIAFLPMLFYLFLYILSCGPTFQNHSVCFSKYHFLCCHTCRWRPSSLASFLVLLTSAFGVVTISFWSLYLMDRELVYPRWLDQIIPNWINHAIHTLNSLFAILDMCLINHKFPSYGFATKVIVGYLLSYGVCLYGTYFQSGIWIYPFLKELTWTQRAVLAVVNVIVALLLYALTKMFNGLLWRGKVASSNKSSKPKKSAKQKTKKAA